MIHRGLYHTFKFRSTLSGFRTQGGEFGVVSRLTNCRFMTTSKEDNEDANDSKASRFKQLLKKYGHVTVCTHLSIYSLTLASLFFALDLDIMSSSTFGFDPITTTKNACDKIEYYTGWSSVSQYVRENPRAGTFAIAWIMAKFTEPFRIGITAMIVPKLGQYIYDRKQETK